MEQKPKQTIPSSEFTKLPPQAKDLEEAVLGALLFDSSTVAQVITFLKPAVFYFEKHRHIYEAIEQLFRDNKPIDLLTVVQKLKSNKTLELVGGPYEVTVLTNRIGSAIHIDYHARLIFQKYLQRELIRIANDASMASYREDADPLELMYKFQKQLVDLESGISHEEIKNIDEIFNDTFDQMRRAKNTKGVLGLESHLKALNESICGFQKGFVHVIAGRPGMGKTALAKSIVLSLVQKRIKCRVFSLEMTSQQLMIGFISEAAEINNQKVAKGELTEQEWHKLEKLRNDIKPYLEIDDTPAINVAYLESQVRKAVKNGVQFIAIDYLQLMTLTKAESKNKIREQEVSYLSSNIKRIAKQYSVPIILLSQLSRAVEERADKVPQLSDLRESGSIEQDAEVVILCYRPEYYKIFQDKSGTSMRGLAKLIIAKNRFGPLEDIITKFYPTLTKYDNFESSVKLEDEQQLIIDTNESDPFT